MFNQFSSDQITYDHKWKNTFIDGLLRRVENGPSIINGVKYTLTEEQKKYYAETKVVFSEKMLKRVKKAKSTTEKGTIERVIMLEDLVDIQKKYEHKDINR